MNEKLIRPNLAGKAPARLSAIRFPMFASAKVDGVRASIQNGVVLSRSLKPIPNKRVQYILGREQFNGLEGELFVGPPNDANVFRNTTSCVMSADCENGLYVVLMAFDIMDPGIHFERRKNQILRLFSDTPHIRPAEQYLVHGASELMGHHESNMLQGYEGTVIRDPYGVYKQGRSTTREQGFLKLKPESDAEAVVIGVRPLMHNNNVAEKNELGLTKRSSHAENLVAQAAVGSLICRTIGKEFPTAVDFDIGVFKDVTKDELRDWWSGRDGLVGRTVKFRYMPTGGKDKPRHPVFLGWRDPIDL